MYLYGELDYEVATFDERTKIKNIGCRYIMFCLECVYILAQWLPTNADTEKDSIFRSCFQMLKKDGVEFPKAAEFTFFSEERVKKAEK